MPTSHLLRCSLFVAVRVTQPVNASFALAQDMGASTFGHKEWCGKVKAVPKSTEKERSSQVRVAASFLGMPLSKYC